MPIYKIIFTDNTVFEGGNSILDNKWKEIPDKDILCLDYFLSENEHILLEKFESYNFFIEATQNVYGPKGMNRSRRLENIYVMGLKNNKVTSYRLSLVGNKDDSRYVQGDLTKRIVDKGKEFRGRPTVGWKKGIK